MQSSFNNTTDTNNRHISLTGTNHCNSKISLFTLKKTITHFFQLKDCTVKGSCVSFKFDRIFFEVFFERLIFIK